jgi:hypothetical protein
LTRKGTDAVFENSLGTAGTYFSYQFLILIGAFDYARMKRIVCLETPHALVIGPKPGVARYLAKRIHIGHRDSEQQCQDDSVMHGLVSNA